MRRVKKLKVFQIYPNFKFCHDFMLGKTFPSNFLPKNVSLPPFWRVQPQFLAILPHYMALKHLEGVIMNVTPPLYYLL